MEQQLKINLENRIEMGMEKSVFTSRDFNKVVTLIKSSYYIRIKIYKDQIQYV